MNGKFDIAKLILESVKTINDHIIYSTITLEEFILTSLKYYKINNYLSKYDNFNSKIIKKTLKNYLRLNIKKITYSEEMLGHNKIKYSVTIDSGLEDFLNILYSKKFYNKDGFILYSDILITLLNSNNDKFKFVQKLFNEHGINTTNILEDKNNYLEDKNEHTNINTNDKEKGNFSIKLYPLKEEYKYRYGNDKRQYIERGDEYFLAKRIILKKLKNNILLSGLKECGKKELVYQLSKDSDLKDFEFFRIDEASLIILNNTAEINIPNDPDCITNAIASTLISMNKPIVLFLNNIDLITLIGFKLAKTLEGLPISIILSNLEKANQSTFSIPEYIDLKTYFEFVNIPPSLNDEKSILIIEDKIKLYAEQYNIYINNKNRHIIAKTLIDSAYTNEYCNLYDLIGYSCNIIDFAFFRENTKKNKPFNDEIISNITKYINNNSKYKIKGKNFAELYKINKDMNLDPENKRILNLPQELKKRILDQNEAIDSISDLILISKLGLSNNGIEKPIASFAFAGPTGVGKTELSKVLANQLSMNVIRFDMSEYNEQHTISSLLGSPTGYVGYEEPGLLFNAVSNNPKSVIIFDEIEKAHPNIFNIFLQILDYGMLKNRKGEEVSFKETICIFTTNVGAESLKHKSIGFSATEESILKDQEDIRIKEMSKLFKPELINRLDGIIHFKPLSKESISSIFNIEIEKLKCKLNEYNISINIDDSLKNKIVNLSLKDNMGARPINRYINKFLNKDIALLILKKENKNIKESFMVRLKQENSNDVIIVPI